MKRVAKAFTLFIASSTYVWLLFMTATTIGAFFTLRDSGTIKQWLDDSGVYTNIVDEVSKLATIQQKQDNALVQITSEDIRTTAQQVFTPERLEDDMEGVIDGFYGWFKGDTDGPQFTVDFSGRQAAFAAAMTAKLEQKINALPECTTSGRFTIQAFDPFTADCKPKDVDLTEELSSFEQELATSEDILPQVRFTGEDVKVNRGTESVRISSAWPWVPNAYKGLLYGPWVVLVLTICAGLALIFLSTSRRKGARRFASGLMFTGVILVLSGVFLRPAFEQLNIWSTQSLGGEASFTQKIIDPIFKEMNETYSMYSVYFGISYIVPALITYGVLLITRHKHDDSESATDEDVPAHQAKAPMQTPVSEYPLEPQHAPAPTMPMNETPPAPEPQSNMQELPSQQTPAPMPISRPTPQPSARPTRPVTRRPPMIQG